MILLRKPSQTNRAHLNKKFIDVAHTDDTTQPNDKESKGTKSTNPAASALGSSDYQGQTPPVDPDKNQPDDRAKSDSLKVINTDSSDSDQNSKTTSGTNVVPNPAHTHADNSHKVEAEKTKTNKQGSHQQEQEDNDVAHTDGKQNMNPADSTSRSTAHDEQAQTPRVDPAKARSLKVADTGSNDSGQNSKNIIRYNCST